MPHADTSIVPGDITTKAAFYDFVIDSLKALLDIPEDQSYWVSHLSNASSLLYNCYLGCRTLYGVTEAGEPVVNWVGFYVRPPHHPSASSPTSPLLLGPFNGRPACQIIQTKSGKGVCADAFVNGKTLVVKDVEAYPGHIACDALSRSEIVLPLRSKDSEEPVGVLDLDSTALATFDEEDQRGLEAIVDLLRI